MDSIVQVLIPTRSLLVWRNSEKQWRFLRFLEDNQGGVQLKELHRIHSSIVVQYTGCASPFFANVVGKEGIGGHPSAVTG